MSSDARINTPQATASGDMTAITGLDLKYPSRIFAAFPDPVMVVNRQGRVVFMNPAAEDLFGCSVGAGEEYPLCSEILQTDMKEHPLSAEQWLRGRVPLNRAPLRLRNRQGELVISVGYRDPH